MATPLEAIVADITLPAVPGEPGSSPGATVYRGGHAYQARAETIRVMKERHRGRRALLALEFDDTEGRPWWYAYGVLEQADGSWRREGGWGGSRGGELSRPGPWANFGGAGHYLGGRVHGADVDRVRFVDRGGVIAEDTIEHGLALLIADAPVRAHGRLELYDMQGKLLANQPWPPKRQPARRRS
ncbi:hypothetical protein [Candidatus Nephthysia bennettiae]|uniref:Uncharacterized protein n=1 Tax=Candidatus Nephthysia bennettiae TaxID=3127016 RepID=A0A934NA79_9BACT|nr:hypothetical protein [Candidatus Dormibacteraeota bacterium]MBJ7607704.1 hypothetical protein [Candidatus Dormibacteraeota bacterium]MBJ7612595.1 hypothetical protein [Candidatus Dormibacteraeota bacterium]